MRSRVLLAMIRVCVTLSVIFSLGRSQVTYTCTDGYEYDDTRHACKDIDECVALPDACKGGMKCVNHFGGYLCLPNNAEIFISTAEDEEGAGPGDAPEPLPPAPDPAPQPGSGPAPGSGPGAGSEAGSSRRATTGTGPAPAPAPLPRQQPAPSGGINCALVPYLCQYQCVNQAGVYGCVCPEGYQLQADRLCEDRNECEEGHYCSADQLCWNYHGGYRCFPRNPCRPPYTAIAEGRCACRSDVPACRGLPSSMVYKYMSITSGRTLPADLFQVASTDASSSMIHTFSIASGNDRQEFYLRTISGRSAMLVMTRPLQGPREAVVDIEMHTHNTALNYRSSAILRLTIVIGAYPF